jgi:hypothetical protein
MAWPAGWTILPPLVVGHAANAWAISADGTTVVGSAEDAGGALHAVYWTEAGGIVDMPVPGSAGAQHAEALSVSADGAVIVGYYMLSGGESRAFRWTLAGGMVALDPRAAGIGRDGRAFGCNGDGSVIVGNTVVPLNSYQLFIWTLAGGFVATGGPGSNTGGDNIGVSPDGSLVYAHGRNDNHFYSWTSGGGWVDSGIAAQANAFFPGGVIVSNAGVAFQIGSDNNTSDAIRQNIAPSPGSVTPGIPATGTFAQADAAPIDGSVLVGTWTDAGFNTFFFSWTQAAGFVSINPPATYTADFVSDWRHAIATDASAFVAVLFDGASLVTPAVYGLTGGTPTPPAAVVNLALLDTPELQFIDANGHPYAMGTLELYETGTSTPKDSWNDPAGGDSHLNTNPIVLDEAGRCIIWGDGLYRVVLRDVAGNLVYDQPSSTLVSAVMIPVVGAATLAIARQAMGVTDAIEAEAEARAAADSAEQLARIAADNNLQSEIDAEIARAEAAEAALGARIDGLPAPAPPGNTIGGEAKLDASGHCRVTFTTPFATTCDSFMVTGAAVGVWSGSFNIANNDRFGCDVWGSVFGSRTPAANIDFFWLAIGH